MKYHQQGTILVIAIVMLLPLTLIGVAAMRGTLLEERMAGNMKEQYRSFQIAELALRQGESEIIENSSNARADFTECDVNIVEVLVDNDFEDVALEDNSLNPNEVLARRHFRYCGPASREYRNDQGVKATSDAGGKAGLHYDYYQLLGVGQIPNNAETALRTTFALLP
ncbi:MAG: PilX N-terminal domain-containing pilus assembly protein [Chromatiales bacterium]|nr:PilX N-terminal domain-containing pilus assembly protein [Chromatiales bacterium]